MTDDKLAAVVRNWYPRFLANGIDFFDLTRTLEAVEEWSDWADAWSATAASYERLGDGALAAGHRVTAAEHLRRASLTLQFAQFVLTDDPPRRRSLQQRMSDVYRRAAPLLDPPAEPVSITYDADRAVVGYLRLPPGVERPGLAVLVPGLESTKEQFSTYEPFFLRRGVATLSVEGPGQGEGAQHHGGRRSAPFRDARYAAAMAAVGAAIGSAGALTAVDPDHVVVVGTSFGGYLALRHGGEIPGLRGVVDIAGPYDLRAFDELQPVTRDGFRDLVDADDEAVARELLHDVTLDGVLDRLTVPVLVVHGEEDTIIAVSHAHRVIAGLAGRATARIEPHGNHSCNNLASVLRPFVADWVADRLGERS